MITWKKNGEEIPEDVDVGETLPNEDGTFQKRAMLGVSSEDWKKSQYTCEVVHTSEEAIIKILNDAEIKSHSKTFNFNFDILCRDQKVTDESYINERKQGITDIDVHWMPKPVLQY